MAKKRANGEGNIRKRKDDRWEGRYTAGYDAKTGRRIIRNVLGRTQAEVNEKLKRALEETNGLDVSKTADEYTVASWLRTWYELYAKPNIRTAIANRYELIIEHYTIIGHVSSSTTLNIYAHVTDEMQRTAAAKIDLGIGKKTPTAEAGDTPRKPTPSTFQPYKGQRRKPGTGCISQINDHLWEGRYSPVVNGRRMARNIYAETEAECEEKLAELISQMKSEIAAEKAG